MREREEDILEFIIRDYIKSAQAVASRRISETGNFQVSPATVRNVMLELDGEGYLAQPHTSAGRVPTDKAYRYFVDFLMEYREPARKERELFDAVFENIHAEHELFFEKFGKLLAEELGLFTAVASFSGKRAGAARPVKAGGFGLEEVMKEPEFEDHRLSVEFARLVDRLDSVAGEYLEHSRSASPSVFIGGENPANLARDFGAVSLKFKDEELGECVVFSIGPKRMNYEKAASLLNFVIRDISESR